MLRFVAASLAAGCATALLNAELMGVFAPVGNPMTDLALIAIDADTGTNRTVANVTFGALPQTYPALSAFDTDKQQLNVAVTSADALYAVDVRSGAVTKVAPLPAYNDSDAFLGLTYTSDKRLLFLTQYTLSIVSGGAITPLASVGPLPADAQVAADAAAKRLFVADAGSTTIYVIALSAPYAVTTIKSTIGAPWDMQWSSALNTLLVLGSYELYTVDPNTGKTARLIQIVDGSGYPRVNTISPDGVNFAFLDFGKFHIIDVTKKSYLPDGPFTLAPRAIGYIQWVPKQ